MLGLDGETARVGDRHDGGSPVTAGAGRRREHPHPVTLERRMRGGVHGHAARVVREEPADRTGVTEIPDPANVKAEF